ncbi:hypothetical protein AMECASPLE_020471 [Ameca splendens]|uniref:Uncharacterized protein n=1 Tax=Ameca splendens TaxID=208324 RepID=A0ABV0ZZM2_9TELE
MLRQVPHTLRPQLQAAASTIEVENMVHVSNHPRDLGKPQRAPPDIPGRRSLYVWAIQVCLAFSFSSRSNSPPGGNRWTQVQIREAIPLDSNPLGVAVISHMGAEVPQNDGEGHDPATPTGILRRPSTLHW